MTISCFSGLLLAAAQVNAAMSADQVLVPLAAALALALVVERVIESTYRVLAGRDTPFAITASMQRAHLKALADLKAARDLNEVQEATIQSFGIVQQASDTARTLALTRIKQQGDQIADLKSLVVLLEKKLRRANPLLSIEAGAGFHKNGLGAIGAVGNRRVRVWGTLQEQGSGVFGGLFLPVF